MSSDKNTRSTTAPAEGRFHARDVRLAGGVSVALVAAILAGGALLAPVADWEGLPSSSGRAGGEAKTVTLAEVPSGSDERSGASGSDGGEPVLSVQSPDGIVALDPSVLAGGTPVTLPDGDGGTPAPASDETDESDEPDSVSGRTANDDDVALNDPATGGLGVDSNGDGYTDQTWAAYKMGPDTDPNGDDDGDGISNKDELRLKTTPNKTVTNGERDADQLGKDSDGDGLRNDIEVKSGMDPHNPDTAGNGLLDGDTDGNGVVDDNDDFDGDGHTNGTEVAAGSDPHSAESVPAPPQEDPPPPQEEPVRPEEDDTPDDDVEQDPPPPDEPPAQPEPVEATPEPEPAAEQPAPPAAEAPAPEAQPAPAAAEAPAPEAQPAPAAAEAPAPEAQPAPAAAEAPAPEPAPAPAVAPPPPPAPPAPAVAPATAPAPAAPEAPAEPCAP